MSFQGLSIAIETMRIIEELMEIWPNEVCDSSQLCWVFLMLLPLLISIELGDSPY